MIRGLYSAASGMKVQSARTDIYAANLANSSTSGYLRNHISQAGLAQALTASSASANAKGYLSGGVTAANPVLDFSPGTIQQTHNSLDLAVVGNGFFCLQTPEGEAYTRNGTFQLANDGTIVTHDGYPLLGTRGPIRIGSSDISVDERGRIWEAGRAVDTLRIADIPRGAETTKRGATVVISREAAPAFQFKIIQGAVEGSNVNSMQELQRMMGSQRQFEANVRAIQAQDESLQVLLRDVVG